MNDLQLKRDFEELFSGDCSWIKNLDGERILVTGSTGLIGSVFGRAILYYNHHFNGNITLICHVRNIQKAKQLYAEYLESPNLEFIVGDINQEIEYNGKVDYMVHCANTTSSLAYVNEPVETIRTIVLGTDRALSYALKKHVKGFIYMSSMEAYGAPIKKADRTTEDESGFINTMNVRSSYSEGKRLAECLCASYSSEYNLRTVVIRSAQVFGAGVSRNDNRVFMQLANSVINHSDFVMHSDGSSYGNYCYTTDAIKAILILMSKGESGQAYNVVNEENTMTIREMAEMVAHDIANDSFKIIYDIPESSLKYGYGQKVELKMSSSKINRLGWKAEIPLKEMYIRLIKSLSE